MTKAEEMDAYARFVSGLPVDSYLGKWLRSVSDEVAADIRNDIFPSCISADSRARCEKIEREAAERAAALVKQAEKRAADVVANAERRADEMRRSVERERAAAYDATRGFLSALTR